MNGAHGCGVTDGKCFASDDFVNKERDMNGLRVGLVMGLSAVALVGCKKTDDSKPNFTNAINTYYASKPACLWSAPVKFPVQANTSDKSKTAGFDALVDQGLLARTTAQKKVFIIASRQVTNYDLSDKGRSAWTADQQQPGFGNFCYGTMKVASIDSYTPTTGQVGATTTVSYHVGISGAPGWASEPETQNGFPNLKADLSGPIAGTATLTDTSGGWLVTQGPTGSTHTPASAADGTIVQ